MFDHAPLWLRLSTILFPLVASSSIVLALGRDVSWFTALSVVYGCIAVTELGYLAWLFASDGRGAPPQLSRSRSRA